MTREPEVEKNIERLEQERRARGLRALLVGVILAVLTGGVAVSLGIARDAQDDAEANAAAAIEQSVRVTDLEEALDAQRTQFEDCRNKQSTDPGCAVPVAPPAASIGPQGIQGLQGLPGLEGLQGIQGAQGIQGVRGPRGPPGADGSDGAAGQDGVGLAGPQGLPGTDGTDGATGPQGPQGDRGERGPVGEAGASAFPFTFSFTVDNDLGNSTTYIVTCVPAGCDVEAA